MPVGGSGHTVGLMSRLCYLIRRAFVRRRGPIYTKLLAGAMKSAQGRMLPRLYIPEGCTSLEEVEHAMVDLAMPGRWQPDPGHPPARYLAGCAAL